MITKLLQGQDRLRVCVWATAFAVVTTAAAAQAPAPRIRSEVNNSVVTTLKASQQPLAQLQNDQGRMPANTKLSGMTIAFGRSAAQQASLEALLAAQQDPTSPLYHQWLNPDQFAAQFGMAPADIEKVEAWLEQQGFSVDSVTRSKNMIRFSGTVGQVERAFQTEMHYFGANGEKHFAPSTLLSVPAAIAPTVESIRNLSDFRPKPMHISTHRAFTSAQTGAVYFAPGDIATTYDFPVSGTGINGTGQSIAIIGQSEIQVSDIEAFQSAAGLAPKDPMLVLVPGTGSAAINPFGPGDQAESSLDIEWSGATAPGATIDFVFTGNDTSKNAFDALLYAIDEKIAPIISSSYGACETSVSINGGFATFESAFQQAQSQGQTILSASGDQGSTACSGDTTDGLSTAQQFALAVNYPASSQYVTGVGGTEITSADSGSYNSSGVFVPGANFSTYWNTPTGTTDLVDSAKIYIPEVAWNDNSTQFGLSASGGGASSAFPQPSYQSSYFTATGETNPNSSQRLVPDVALYASPNFPGYLYCTSDTSAWNTTVPPLQQASCNSQFRDGATGELTVAGGTSFATPIFAGIIALINQQQQWTAGQGLANTTLYKLASNSTTYAAAFHDVTTGNNNCNAGTAYCGSTTGGFSATAGYDQVTGLGSVDVAKLAAAWPANASPLIGTATTLSATTTAPTTGQNDTITITVTSVSGSTIPSGTVNLSIDGSSTAVPVTLASNGTATYTANFTTAGAHTIVALYAGDTTHATSTGSIVLNVAGTSSGKGTFAMSFSPTTLTVSQGSQGTATLTVTPSGGYTGTVNLAFNTSNNTALANLCVFAGSGLTSAGDITVSNSAAVQGQITIDTNASDCTTAAMIRGHGSLRLIPRANAAPHANKSMKASNEAPKNNRLPAGIALAGLLLAGFLGRSSRKLRQLACVVALASLGLAISACGGTSSNNPTTVPNPAKGTYTITFTGQDSVTATITSSAQFQLVID